MCPTCHFQPCCCHTLRIIRKRHERLTRISDLNKLEEYFGMEDTDYVRHSISLQKRGLFSYQLVLKKMNIYDPLSTYIQELPSDINNVIYSYLSEPILVLRAWIILPRGYPFENPVWKVTSYIKDGKRQDAAEETKNVNCIMNNTTPSMTIEKEILYYATTLLLRGTKVPLQPLLSYE